MAGNRNSGRKPRPTRLKILRGEPNKSRINTNEPQPKPSKGRPPTWLSDPAKTLWKKLAPELLRVGILAVADEEVFACYCQNVARLARMERELKGGKAILDRADMMTIKDLQLLIVKIGAEFGLTPSSRSRITVGKGVEPDKLDALKAKYGKAKTG